MPGTPPVRLVVAWAAAAAVIVGLCGLLTRGLGAAGAGGAEGVWRPVARRLRADRWAVAALCLIVALVVLALLAPLLAPYDPAAQPDIVGMKGLPPSLAHPFGTDVFSRDVLSRALYGARISLAVAVLSVLLSTTVGTAYGAAAGYAGGHVDAVLMRLLDALLSIPQILLIIGVLSLWGRIPLTLLVLLLGLTSWFGVARVVRAEARALRGRDFVTSARALGASAPRILVRHVLPNVVSRVIVSATLNVGNVIVLEAGLSFLGIGVRPPQPSWGNIIQDGGEQLFSYWWIALFPGLLIVTTVMAFNALGDGLRDALDPRTREEWRMANDGSEIGMRDAGYGAGS